MSQMFVLFFLGTTVPGSPDESNKEVCASITHRITNFNHFTIRIEFRIQKIIPSFCFNKLIFLSIKHKK